MSWKNMLMPIDIIAEASGMGEENMAKVSSKLPCWLPFAHCSTSSPPWSLWICNWSFYWLSLLELSIITGVFIIFYILLYILNSHLSMPCLFSSGHCMGNFILRRASAAPVLKHLFKTHLNQNHGSIPKFSTLSSAMYSPMYPPSSSSSI